MLTLTTAQYALCTPKAILLHYVTIKFGYHVFAILALIVVHPFYMGQLMQASTAPLVMHMLNQGLWLMYDNVCTQHYTSVLITLLRERLTNRKSYNYFKEKSYPLV